ncbi:MAG TPA: winged helix-turn-helix domain-containing protein [Candidatus Baltobacteraceae bacterium]|nr:winged helix-turn-helix domain-containing protein [Candidatus Baltobacteraceae bacterium]
MSDPGALAAEAVVPDLDALRVLADGQRHRMLTLLIEEPLNARQLSERLDMPRTRLYYHLGLLEKHGIIRAVGSRHVGSTVERTFRAVAQRFRVDRGVLASSASTAAIDAAQAEIVDAVALDLRSRARRSNAETLVARAFTRLTAERYTDLRKRLRALLAEFEKPDANGTPVEIAAVLFAAEDLR